MIIQIWFVSLGLYSVHPVSGRIWHASADRYCRHVYRSLPWGRARLPTTRGGGQFFKILFWDSVAIFKKHYLCL